MYETRKAARSFRVDGFAILTRWPALATFLLIAAFSGAGFQSANSILQQCRQLFDSEGGDNTLQLANREQPRLAVVVASSEKHKSSWHGSLDGIIPSAHDLPDDINIRRSVVMPNENQRAGSATPAVARGPPHLS